MTAQEVRGHPDRSMARARAYVEHVALCPARTPEDVVEQVYVRGLWQRGDWAALAAEASEAFWRYADERACGIRWALRDAQRPVHREVIGFDGPGGTFAEAERRLTRRINEANAPHKCVSRFDASIIIR